MPFSAPLSRQNAAARASASTHVIDAAPARVEAAASATLGLVATAQGALWYFHADAAHDDEFGDEA